MTNLFEDADAMQQISNNLKDGLAWDGSVPRTTPDPRSIGEGPFIALDTFKNAVEHLHDELDKVTGATVDIDDMRYECHPTVAAYIEHLRAQIK